MSDALDLLRTEIRQIRSAVELLVGAVERTSAVVEAMLPHPFEPDHPSMASTPDANVVPFRSRPGFPLSFADPAGYEIDEQLNAQIIAFSPGDDTA